MNIASSLETLKLADHEKYPVATEADLQLTESAIGVRLPESYRTFVKEFSNGAYLYMIQEVSSVGQGNPQIAPIQGVAPRTPEEVGETLIPYRDGGAVHPQHLIPFSLDGNGNAWCFVTDSESKDDIPVAYMDYNGGKLYAKLASFEEWLSILITGEPDEVIRKVCDESIITEELCLG